MEQQTTSRFTILIKALNEESRIAACLEGALKAAQSLGGDVLLVDSLSSDATVEIARRYPVRIVQFASIGDRGCGAAVQLGFQYSVAPYIYVLDADMVLEPGFVKKALALMEQDPRLAGVGGKLVDTRIATDNDARRVAAAAKLVVPVKAPELGGGGLYRREAIESVGYLANRWLAAFEEADLGMRLRAAGWHMLRLPDIAVTHEGHAESNWQMMRRLWRNRRAHAGGALLRSAWGKPWFGLAVRKQAYVLAVPAAHLAALAIALAAWSAGYSGTAAFGLVWAGLCLAMVLRKRSLGAGLWALASWHFYALASFLGMWARPRDPMLSIPSSDITKGPAGKERTQDMQAAAPVHENRSATPIDA